MAVRINSPWEAKPTQLPGGPPLRFDAYTPQELFPKSAMTAAPSMPAPTSTAKPAQGQVPQVGGGFQKVPPLQPQATAAPAPFSTVSAQGQPQGPPPPFSPDWPPTLRTDLLPDTRQQDYGALQNRVNEAYRQWRAAAEAPGANPTDIDVEDAKKAYDQARALLGGFPYQPNDPTFSLQRNANEAQLRQLVESGGSLEELNGLYAARIQLYIDQGLSTEQAQALTDQDMADFFPPEAEQTTPTAPQPSQTVQRANVQYGLTGAGAAGENFDLQLQALRQSYIDQGYDPGLADQMVARDIAPAQIENIVAQYQTGIGQGPDAYSNAVSAIAAQLVAMGEDPAKARSYLPIPDPTRGTGLLNNQQAYDVVRRSLVDQGYNPTEADAVARENASIYRIGDFSGATPFNVPRPFSMLSPDERQTYFAEQAIQPAPDLPEGYYWRPTGDGYAALTGPDGQPAQLEGYPQFWQVGESSLPTPEPMAAQPAPFVPGAFRRTPRAYYVPGSA